MFFSPPIMTDPPDTLPPLPHTHHIRLDTCNHLENAAAVPEKPTEAVSDAERSANVTLRSKQRVVPPPRPSDTILITPPRVPQGRKTTAPREMTHRPTPQVRVDENKTRCKRADVKSNTAGESASPDVTLDPSAPEPRSGAQGKRGGGSSGAFGAGRASASCGQTSPLGRSAIPQSGNATWNSHSLRLTRRASTTSPTSCVPPWLL
ncbi:hypothetical protein B0H11DRAFT_663693 [Mycena galericulata]|nr:hypothetical protein B0H11DRAFT_663693 [Mycena galericulata]